MSAASQIIESQLFLFFFSVCVGCVGDVGTYFLLVTFLSLEAVCACVYVHVLCCGVQSNVKHIVGALLVCEVSTFLPPISVSPLSATHQPPTHPSALTGRARSGNRRSPNPSVTP